MAKYNRSLARQYARYYAKSVCHDGAIGASPGVAVSAPPNAPLTRGTYLSRARENDCTHFISCCIGNHGAFRLVDKGRRRVKSGKPGGGVPITQHDAIQLAYGITGAPKLVKYLLDKGYAKVVGRPKMRKSRDVVDLINKELHMGDVIAYSSASTGNGYGHMAMHL